VCKGEPANRHAWRNKTPVNNGSDEIRPTLSLDQQTTPNLVVAKRQAPNEDLAIRPGGQMLHNVRAGFAIVGDHGSLGFHQSTFRKASQARTPTAPIDPIAVRGRGLRRADSVHHAPDDRSSYHASGSSLETRPVQTHPILDKTEA